MKSIPEIQAALPKLTRREADGYVFPGDIPVQAYDRVSLVVNATAAKRLGLTIPQSVLLRADEVIGQ